MEVKDYISILAQSPIAAILLFFIYKVFVLLLNHQNKTHENDQKTIEKLIDKIK